MGFRFLPREFNFFDLFDKQVDYAVEAAVLFKEIAAMGAVDAAFLTRMRRSSTAGTTRPTASSSI